MLIFFYHLIGKMCNLVITKMITNLNSTLYEETFIPSFSACAWC